MLLIAMDHLARAGHETTVEKLIEATGYSRSAIYRSRAWLDQHIPAWRGVPSEDTSEPQDGPLGPASLAPVPTAIGRALTPACGIPAALRPVPIWKQAVVRHQQDVVGRRSWDLYLDVYSPAADEVFAAGDIGELIALTAHYVEAATGTTPDAAERKRVAALVRSHGKAALHGLREALMRTDDHTFPEMCRYATAVAQATHAKLRTRDTAQEAQA